MAFCVGGKSCTRYDENADSPHSPERAGCDVVLIAGCFMRGKARRASDAGQATVEAAFLAPVVLLGILMLVQPAIVLYDRMVMEAAASEACRLMKTLHPDDAASSQGYIERRLKSIPRVDVFHAGEWVVDLEGGEGFQDVRVRIEHGLRPLPVIGAAMGFFGLTDGSGLYRQEVCKEMSLHDDWLVNSEFGFDARAWSSRWEEKV